ncbi:MAG TPA: metallophosphatase domain-containing protein [Acidobacteriaceae bacterium]|jgi:Icc-related predicted phosphoesterase
MRICIVSDTHQLENELTIPPCEMLLHCGDWSFFGKSVAAMDAFNDWIGEQPARFKVVTCGNHEYPVQADPEGWRRRLSNATLLLNESVTIEGIKIFGSPITPLYGGAFGMSNEADREKLYSTIPADTDILMTHGAPQGVLDADQGCAALRRTVLRIKPRLHCFGHVHSAYGTLSTKTTLFVNAAIVDEDFAPTRKPVLLDFKSS